MEHMIAVDREDALLAKTQITDLLEKITHL
jgi:hypothetical protein